MGIERNSSEIGRAHGIYVNSALDGTDLHLLMSFVLNNKAYNGSTCSDCKVSPPLPLLSALVSLSLSLVMVILVCHTCSLSCNQNPLVVDFFFLAKSLVVDSSQVVNEKVNI